MNKKIKYLLVGILAIALLGTALGLVVITKTVHNTGVIVYGDLKVSEVDFNHPAITGTDWGQIRAGESSRKDLFIMNTGSTPLTVTMATTNWTPSQASSLVTITPSFDNTGDSYVLQAGEGVALHLTLSVASGAVGVTSFGFDLVLTGTESQ